MSDTSRQTAQVSLTWRALTLTSLVLLALAIVISMLGNASMTARFEAHQEELFERKTREIDLALGQSSAELLNLASVLGIAAVEVRGLLGGSEGYRLLQAEWLSIELSAGVDTMQVLLPSGLPLGRWGPEPLIGRDAEGALLAEVLGGERPASGIVCAATCRQYVAAPALGGGEIAAIVILERGLADIATDVAQISGANVGLFVEGEVPEVPPEMADGWPIARPVPAWGGQMPILTRAEESFPLLMEASARAQREALREEPMRLRVDGRTYSIGAVPVPGGTGGEFILVRDVTAGVRAIGADTRALLYATIGGWAVAALILLAILWGPMARIRRLADALPALALGEYTKLRRAVGPGSERLRDEIDVLDGAALDLAAQLEHLEGEVGRHADQLETQMAALRREKDFASRLLDTARVVILTQEANGRIARINHFGETLVGEPAESLVGRSFSSVFLGGDPAASRKAADAPAMEEGVFGAIDGGPVTIAWYHANLHDSGDGGAAVVSVGLDVTARKGAEQHLGWLASHDTLTGLYNRRQLQAGLEAALARDEGGAVIHFDLDSFRDVNDSSGHHAGDELLRLIASTLEREFSERGVLARMGGDEFALLVEGADESQAVDCAERITRTLDELVFVDQGRRHRIQASIGIVCFPRHGETCQELLANADLAMYRAKEAGKSWHVLLDESGSEAKAAVRQRVYWSDALREALREDRLELHAQPIMHLESGRIGHFEVLVRLRDQTGVLHPPSSFIPVAERSGQISQIDLHVLAAALREIGDEGRRSAPVSLAVNLSAQTLRDDDFVAELAERLRESGADPARLTLEITETVAVTDFAATRRVMEAVSALGCQFALDDFGVGFSSFHYLAQLPAALIKIDGSFIRGLAASRERQAIVSAISAIAQGFDKRTVAEFVETEADAAVLRAMGIDYAQGDFVGKPLPIAEALSMDELSLRRRPPRPRNALP